MVSYKTLGLVNTREMFKKAINGGYAIPAFNFNNMEQLQAIVSRLQPRPSLRLSSRFQRVHVTMPTRLFSAIWLREQ